MIAKPGFHDLTNAEYHADPALSASGAKALVPPSAPAKFRHQLDHPVYRDVFDFGSAAHKMVLQDETALLEVIDAPDWKTKAAREARDAARAEGKIPILPTEFEVVAQMAQKIMDHPIASRLFQPGSGRPEVSMFWEDPVTGVMLRARPDWLPDVVDGRRLIVPDYKTAHSAERDAFAKNCAAFGYHQQAAWYLDGLAALGYGDAGNAFVFVAQEKTAPYLVSIYELDQTALNFGRALNRLAIDTYARCLEEDKWPGYSDDVEILDLPIWYQRQMELVL